MKEVSKNHIPMMASARWVLALFCDVWVSAWLQNETVMGYWVSIDPDGKFHFVSEIKEI